MSLSRCSHGEPMGLSCYACEAMRRSIEAAQAQPEDEPRCAETFEERVLRSESRWPEWLRRMGGRP